LLVAKLVLVIKHAQYGYLAYGAFWQPYELTTDVGPRQHLAKIAKIGYQWRMTFRFPVGHGAFLLCVVQPMILFFAWPTKLAPFLASRSLW
jgi:hypothetical protein